MLAQERCQLSARAEAMFSGLIHPVHNEGAIYIWELLV
jgi:hypothetical protein